MLPVLCRPTPQQSEADTHATATMSLTALPFAESTIAQLPLAGAEGSGVALFACKSAVELPLDVARGLPAKAELGTECRPGWSFAQREGVSATAIVIRSAPTEQKLKPSNTSGPKRGN